ncbi:MAG: succinate--CoA ligase subunit beta [Rhodospirillaceae bacterium]|nr:succinate--CoA ligase subunit beta [Rhodospirillaceae bacterium]
MILEYQLKGLLRKLDVPVPPGAVAYIPEEAAEAARRLGGPGWLVKAQGCRPAALAPPAQRLDTPEAVAAAAAELLGQGRGAAAASRVYIEPALPALRAFAVGVGFDHAAGAVVYRVREGPRTLSCAVDVAAGPMPHYARRLAAGLALDGAGAAGLGRLLASLYRALFALDAVSLQADPAMLTADGAILAVGISADFDPAARFRHPEIVELEEDEEADDAVLAEAARQGFTCVRLGGNVGCMANGAGLAMASMDLVRRHGGEPGTLLDLGGGATREQVAAGLGLMLADASVEAVLICLFAALVRADAMAESLAAAMREAGVRVPVVLRLAGTNADLGRRILNQSGLAIRFADSLDTAAAEVVKAVREYV